MLRSVVIFITLAALVRASELDDIEQKKRGAGKPTSINSIPSGAQKPEYTYSIYPQNPSQSVSYQPQQLSQSFYPNQGNQYYSSAAPTDSSYPQQPQINLIPPPSSSQFVPLNFVPNSGYQAKYQVVPGKGQNGNLQLTLIQQPLPSPVNYQTLFAPNAQNSNGQSQYSLPPQAFNVAPNFQQYPINSPYLAQQYQPQMLFLAQPNPYNNVLYQNPLQSFYNYYPGNAQPKYNPSYQTQPQVDTSNPPQSVSKDDNDIAHSSTSEYLSPQESTSYKSSYPNRSSYSKL